MEAIAVGLIFYSVCSLILYLIIQRIRYLSRRHGDEITSNDSKAFQLVVLLGGIFVIFVLVFALVEVAKMLKAIFNQNNPFKKVPR